MRKDRRLDPKTVLIVKGPTTLKNSEYESKVLISSAFSNNQEQIKNEAEEDPVDLFLLIDSLIKNDTSKEIITNCIFLQIENLAYNAIRINTSESYDPFSSKFITEMLDMIKYNINYIVENHSCDEYRRMNLIKSITVLLSAFNTDSDESNKLISFAEYFCNAYYSENTEKN